MATVLWRFQFSTTQSFVIEVGPLYMRFYKNGAPVFKTGTTPYGIATPYADADLRELQYEQINDVIYITHPSYAPRKLSRIADTNWVLAEVAFTTPPTLDENVTDLTITPSDTSGEITLTASDPLFVSGHVGSIWRIGHPRQDADRWIYLTSAQAPNPSADYRIQGDWQFHTYGVWGCDIVLESIGLDWAATGEGYKVVRKWSGKSDRNIDASGTSPVDQYFRLRIENWESNTNGRAVLEAIDGIIYGVVKITGVTDSTHASASVLTFLENTTATNIWQEGAFSTYRGYPRTVVVHEERLMFGGTASFPSRIWGSVVGDYENFLRSTDDDASISFDLAGKELHDIQWLVSNTDLLVGTSGGEWRVTSRSTEKPLTPSSIDAKQHSTYGSEYIQAQVVDGVILFVQRKSRKLRELVYQYDVDKYVAADLTLLSEHVTEGGILQLAYQKEPIPILWAVTGEGALIGLTYSRDQQVIGWHRHPTEGSVKSVATIYGSSGTDDEVWLIVDRTINGSSVQYVERFDPNVWTDKEDAHFVDCGIVAQGGATNYLININHLEGATVDALADGVVIKGLTVSGGRVDFDGYYENIHLGLPYTSTLTPMRIDSDSTVGVFMGQVRRIGELILRVRDALAIKFNDGTSEYAHNFKAVNEAIDSTQTLYSGDSKVDFHGDLDYDAPITIIQDNPLPLVVQAIIPKYEVTGK